MSIEQKKQLTKSEVKAILKTNNKLIEDLADLFFKWQLNENLAEIYFKSKKLKDNLKNVSFYLDENDDFDKYFDNAVKFRNLVEDFWNFVLEIIKLDTENNISWIKTFLKNNDFKLIEMLKFFYFWNEKNRKKFEDKIYDVISNISGKVESIIKK